MELKDFIVSTVLDVQDAVCEIEELSGQKYRVSERDTKDYSEMGVISFDVAVTQADGQSVSGKAKVGIVEVLGAGVDATLKEEAQNASRIKFALRVAEVRDLQKSKRNQEAV